MKIKTIIVSILMCICLIFCVGCSSSNTSEDSTDTAANTTSSSIKQTAEAWLQEEDIKTAAKVDLSGGWSVEFTSGAIYLYDKEITSETESTAMLITLREEVYNEYLAEAEKSDTYKETDDYIYYEDIEINECKYLYKLGKAYFLITVKDKENANNITDVILKTIKKY